MLLSAATTVATPIFFGVVVDAIVESRSSVRPVARCCHAWLTVAAADAAGA
jgi:hypothetical protein